MRIDVPGSERLVLAASRSTHDDHELEMLRRLTDGDVDWSYVVECSIRHAVAPLVWHSLAAAEERVGAVAMPADARHELRSIHAGSVRRSRRMLTTIAHVAVELHDAGIDVMALKDVELVPEVYPAPELRPMGDIDLLVKRDAYDDAALVLGRLGFDPVPDGDRPYTRKYAPGQQFRRAADETWIDLQWHVGEREWQRDEASAFAPAGFDTESLWARAVSFSVHGVELLAPSPEDMFIHLCVHLEGHEYAELVLFSDLVEMVRHYGSALDWSAIVERALSGGTASSVGHALETCQGLLGLEVPAGVCDQLRVPYFTAELHRPLFANLTPLHVALDEVRAAAAPPDDVLTRMESLVRTQVAEAALAFSIADAIATALSRAAVAPVVVDGASPPRVFPDAVLDPFAPIDLVATSVPLETVAVTLGALGFVRDGGEHWRLDRPLESSDPAVPMGRTLAVVVEVSGNAADAFAAAASTLAATKTNSRIALEAVRRHARRANEREQLVIRVFALTPAEAAAVVAARVGAAVEDRLFRAAGAAELLDAVRTHVQDEQITAAGASHGRAGDVRTGLALLGRSPAGGGAPVLEWARYGPGDLHRRTELRDAFLWLLAAAAVDGFGARVRFVARSLRPGEAGGRAVTRAVRAALAERRMRHVRSRGRDERVTARAFAYWLETADTHPAPERTESELVDR